MKGNDEDVLEPTLIILTGGDFAGYASEYNGTVWLTMRIPPGAWNPQ